MLYSFCIMSVDTSVKYNASFKNTYKDILSIAILNSLLIQLENSITL